MKIAVAGGSGTVGTQVVASAEEAGHDVVVLSRSHGTDLMTGAGLDESLVGVDAVIDVSNVATLRRRTAVEFFATVTKHLLAAEQRAGVGHHVALSIVGIDEVTTGYYQGKAAQERAIAEGSVPWSVLRATQFHEFAGQLLASSAVGPFVLVPRMRSQPVAAQEVAAALVELTVGTPRGRAPELAGPEVLEMPEMVRRLLRASGVRKTVVPLPLPGRAGKAMRGGGLIPHAPGPRGSQTYDEWLAEQPV